MANFDVNKAGFVIVGMFILTRAVALSCWRFGHIEQRRDLAAVKASSRATRSGRRLPGYAAVTCVHIAERTTMMISTARRSAG